VPLGDADFYALRVEAGTPEYGIDIDETRFVMEVARVARAVSYEKGCFPGQEPIVMARDRAGFINRAFLRLVVKSDSPLPRGAKLFHENQEVGIVTDSAISPRTKRPVAMGYVKRGFQSPGQLIEARDGNAVTPVEVVGPPIMS
jgi:folate-binding protein YgfZ